MITLFKKKPKDDSATGVKNWYKDKHQTVIVQRNILALSTFLALIVAGISVFTVLRLTPLKSLEPFVVSIDEQTGIVQRLDSVGVAEVTAEEAINNYFVVRYVKARETYDVSTLRENYTDVRVMTSRNSYREFLLEKRRSNPESPQAVLGEYGKRNIKINRITYLDAPEARQQGIKVAQISGTMEDRTPRSPVPLTYKVVITVSFQFANLQLSQEERYRNPLGFQVVSYRMDRETL